MIKKKQRVDDKAKSRQQEMQMQMEMQMQIFRPLGNANYAI